MIEQIFTVFDTKSKTYSPTIYFKQIGEASRAFSDAVNKENHQYNLHPEDYSLYHIGQWDNLTAKYTDIDPKLLYTGLQLKNPEPDHVKESQQHDTPIQPSTKGGNSAQQL